MSRSVQLSYRRLGFDPLGLYHVAIRLFCCQRMLAAAFGMLSASGAMLGAENYMLDADLKMLETKTTRLEANQEVF
jgi:hypothetical protein